MVNSWLARIFGSRNQRIVSSLQGLVKSVGALETKIAALSDDALANQTVLFRERLAKGESLDSIRAEAFATVREAGKRV
ncbi:hypothetical protein, partial [Hydrocarboniphaga effusa]